MRDVIFAIVCALCVLWIALALALFSIDTHEARQLKNAYYPFTVELQVRDI